tara:strand:+ start:1251 stop:1562 length:312 start_codon:yes stop_codon:yes gene_type:complete
MTKKEQNKLIDHLTRDRTNSWAVVDEMTHTGKSGITMIERWPVGNASDAPWVWRLMWKPATARAVPTTRIAFGLEDSKDEATAIGRAVARRLAKERRAEAAAN